MGEGGGGCLFLFDCLFFSNVPDRLSKHIELCLSGLWLSRSTRRPQPLKWRRPDVWQVDGGWAKGLCPAQVCSAWRRWAACDITRDLASTWWCWRWEAARCLNHDPHITDLCTLPPVFIAILCTHPGPERRYHRPHSISKSSAPFVPQGCFLLELVTKIVQRNSKKDEETGKESSRTSMQTRVWLYPETRI